MLRVIEASAVLVVVVSGARLHHDDIELEPTGGLAFTRCANRPVDPSWDELLPYTATARGQKPQFSGGYTLPLTRVYLCHDPMPGTPAGFLYLYGLEYPFDNATDVWERILPQLLPFSAPSHGHSHSYCEISHEFNWGVDEALNVILAPQWEMKESHGLEVSDVMIEEVFRVLSASAFTGAAIPRETMDILEPMFSERSVREACAHKHFTSFAHSCRVQAGIYARACWRCLGQFYQVWVSKHWFRETKHGDLTPGKSPVAAADRRLPAAVKPHLVAARLFAAKFHSSDDPPALDALVAGLFRGPARAGGNAILCVDKRGKPLQWYLDNMSGYALYRVPFDVMLPYMNKNIVNGTGYGVWTAPEEVYAKRLDEEDDMRTDLSMWSAKLHSEREMNMTSMCAVARLMQMPPATSIRTIALGGVTQTLASCG
uniref:Uncharacterized protein n=1 Tax=Noctiluca scintillans TaxID=2966 RepID=A0A7S1F0Z1_NOCSC